MSERPWPSDAETGGGERGAVCTLSAFPAVQGWASSAKGLAVLWEFGSHLAPSPHHRHQTTALRAGSPWQVPAWSVVPEPPAQRRVTNNPLPLNKHKLGAVGNAPAALPSWKLACSSSCAEQEPLSKPVPWHREGVRSFYLTVQLRKFSHEAGMKTCAYSKSKYSIEHGHFFPPKDNHL